MPTLNDFFYTDNVDDVLAEYVNRLVAGNLRGELTETKTITATLALTDGDLPIQNLTPDGADKTVKLPMEAISNHVFVVRNGSGSYQLVLKNSTEMVTFATIAPGSMLIASPIGGLTWAVDNPPPAIDDSQAPGASPTSVVQMLSMLANIVKSMTGAADWYSAAVVPFRAILGANALGTMVPASTTTYLPIYGTAFDTTEHEVVIPFSGVIRNLKVVTSTAQPASGTLTIMVRKNGVDTAVVATVPANGAAGTHSSSISLVVAAGDVITVKFANAATGVSAAVKGVTLEVAIV